jgi:hypothetical protein
VRAPFLSGLPHASWRPSFSAASWKSPAYIDFKLLHLRHNRHQLRVFGKPIVDIRCS